MVHSPLKIQGIVACAAPKLICGLLYLVVRFTTQSSPTCKMGHRPSALGAEGPGPSMQENPQNTYHPLPSLKQGAGLRGTKPRDAKVDGRNMVLSRGAQTSNLSKSHLAGTSEGRCPPASRVGFSLVGAVAAASSSDRTTVGSCNTVPISAVHCRSAETSEYLLCTSCCKSHYSLYDSCLLLHNGSASFYDFRATVVEGPITTPLRVISCIQQASDCYYSVTCKSYYPYTTYYSPYYSP